MIRLLTAVLLLTYSLFGWAMAYPEDYSGVPHGDFKEGDVIDHTKFNQNHLSIKEAINDRVPVPSNCSTDQIIKYDGSGWVCADMPSGGGGGDGTGIPSGSLAIKTSSGVILGRVVQPDRGRPDAYTTVDGNVVIIGELDDGKFSKGDPESVRYEAADCAGNMYVYALRNMPRYGINAAGDFVYPSGVLQSYTTRSMYTLSQGCENYDTFDYTGFPSTAAPNFPVDLDAIDGEYIQFIVAP